MEIKNLYYDYGAPLAEWTHAVSEPALCQVSGELPDLVEEDPGEGWLIG